MKYSSKAKIFILGLAASFSVNAALPGFNVSNPVDAGQMLVFDDPASGIDPAVMPAIINNKGDIISVPVEDTSEIANPNYFYSGESGEVIAKFSKDYGGYAMNDETIFLLSDFLTDSRGLLKCPIANLQVDSAGLLDVVSSCQTVATNISNRTAPIAVLNSRFGTASGAVASISTVGQQQEVHLYDASNNFYNLGAIESGFLYSVFTNDNSDGSVSVFVNVIDDLSFSSASLIEYKLEQDLTVAVPAPVVVDGNPVRQSIVTSNHQLITLREQSAGVLEAFTCNLLVEGNCENLQQLNFSFSVPAPGFPAVLQASSKGFFIVTVLNTQNPALPSSNSWVVDYTETGNFINVKDKVQEAFTDTPNTIFAAIVSENSYEVVVGGAVTSADSTQFGSPADLWILDAETSVDPLGSTLIVAPESTQINSANTPSTNIDLQLNAQDLFAIEVACTTSNDNITLNSRTAGPVFPAVPNSLLIDTTNLGANVFAQATSMSSTTNDEGVFVPAQPLTANDVYASLVYSVKPVSGMTDITCVALGSDADGLPQTITVTNATVVLDNGINPKDPEDGQIVNGTVLIPVGVDPTDVVVRLTIGDVSITTTVDANGFFSFDNIKMTDVIISIESTRTVAECSGLTVGNEVASTGDIPLYRGDVNRDGIINMADFTMVSSRFGLSEGESRYRAKTDLNKDGTINVQDLAILGSAYGLSACDPEAI